MDKQIFLPKGTDGRKKDTMILHIMSFGLIAALMVMLFSSWGILFRSVLDVLLTQSGVLDTFNTGSAYGTELTDELAQYGYINTFSAANPFQSPIYETYQNIMGVINTVGYITVFLAMAVVIVLVIFMRKRIKDIIEDPFPMDEPIKVKKTPYIWLGFLLGGFGGHLFYIKETKKAIIYLIFGIIGTGFPIFFFYTSAISFADAFAACFMEKDEDGYITIENYPYWL